MVQKQRQKVILDNAVLDGMSMRAVTGTTPSASVVAAGRYPIPRVEVLTLTAKSISVAAADDFGSAKLCDFPAEKTILLAAVIDLVATGGGAVVTITDVDVALGTVATTSTGFTNAGEDDIVEKIDVAALGVTQGNSIPSLMPKVLAASAALYLNIATGNIASPGTVSFTGTVTLIYLDLGT